MGTNNSVKKRTSTAKSKTTQKSGTTSKSSKPLTEAEKKRRAKLKKAKKRRARRRRIIGTIVALLILGGVIAGGCYLLKHYSDMINRGSESVDVLESAEIPEEPSTVPETESNPEGSQESNTEGTTESNPESIAESTTDSTPESKEAESSQAGQTAEFTLTNWQDYSSDVYVCENVQNFLLIGIDTRGNATYMNTDVMMIATINEDTGEISLTSLMRDMLVYIPEIHGTGAYGRLNAAAAWGGVPLLIKTIETNFNIHIDHYAKVNFNSFVDVINVIGGVDVEMSAEEAAAVNNDEETYYGNLAVDYTVADKISEESGTHHLNGTQALAFVRLRRLDSDFQRTERQRKVITAAIAQCKTLSLTEMNEMLEAVLPYVETDEDLGELEILKLITKGLAQYLQYPVNSYRLPVWGAYTNYTLKESTGVTAAGAQVLMPDFAACIDYFFEKVYHK